MRAGSDRAQRGRVSSTRRRMVRSPGSTSRRDTPSRRSQPRARAILVPGGPCGRAPRASPGCPGMTDFTSTTSSVPVGDVEGEHVDGASLAGDGERHLGRDVPALRPRASGRRPRRDAAWSAIEQPVERLALPQEPMLEPRSERDRHAAKQSAREVIGAATLDPLDGAAGDTGMLGEDVLRPAAPPTQRTKDQTESDGIHATIVASAAYVLCMWAVARRQGPATRGPSPGARTGASRSSPSPRRAGPGAGRRGSRGPG